MKFLWIPFSQNISGGWFFSFFNYLAAIGPILGHFWGDNLTHPMSITAFFIFGPKVTGSLVNDVGSVKPVERLVEFVPGTLCGVLSFSVINHASIFSIIPFFKKNACKSHNCLFAFFFISRLYDSPSLLIAFFVSLYIVNFGEVISIPLTEEDGTRNYDVVLNVHMILLIGWIKRHSSYFFVTRANFPLTVLSIGLYEGHRRVKSHHSCISMQYT